MRENGTTVVNDGGSSSAAQNPPNTAYGADTAGASANSGATASGSGMSYYDYLAAITDANNAYNQAQVEYVNAYNAHEAQKNRDWQERMARHAHEYEVEDLIRAGLNPILSAGGQGAYVGSGAQASGQKAVADNTLGNGAISLMCAAMQASTSVEVAKIYAAAQIAGQDKTSADKNNYNDVWKLVTSMNNQTSSANNERSNTYGLIETIMRLMGYGLGYKMLSKGRYARYPY